MTIQKQLWTIIVEENEFFPNSKATIKEDEFHYLANVLRLKVGDEIEVTNCRGIKASAKIESISKKEAILIVLNAVKKNKIHPQIHLYLATPKPSTLEEVVSAASEMGLDEIHVFRTEKCASKAPFKLEKLERLSNEAVRVSKSAFSTQVFVYENIEELFQKRKCELGIEKELSQHSKSLQGEALNLFCDESHIYENKVTNMLLKVLLENLNEKQTINLIIGPEASFSKQERDFIFKNLPCFPVSLGDNILRVPNAVMAAVSVALQCKSFKTT